ncbi:hypothetical protein SteCoe_4159 [Stentor coeruleus]|uniref:Uncharacterized protein n=1 Tax=Stentor coeruleus TaxID=5963 RepID=A0A1R2CVB7_9CILI|nr:hypothetical protein SteCoe_4159 [Stentor coeruleus]
MITQINKNSDTEPDLSNPILSTNNTLEKILNGLSCMISPNALNLANVGILIYDPYSLYCPLEKQIPKPKSSVSRSISLRSKSTRNLNIRNNSTSSLIKSFNYSIEKSVVDNQIMSKNFNISDKLNNSKSRNKIVSTSKRQKKKTRDVKKNKQILQDVYNVKYKQKSKSIRNISKDKISRRSLIKISQYGSLSPSKTDTRGHLTDNYQKYFLL